MSKREKEDDLSFTSPNQADHKVSKLQLHLDNAFDRGVNFRLRIIEIADDIDADQFKKVDMALSEMEADSGRTVTIRINSIGGSVYDALGIVGRMRSSKCRIVTEGYGCVMSAATLILAAGDHRRMSKYGWFMHHEARYEVSDRSHSAAVNFIKQSEREELQWSKFMEQFTKKDAKFWRRTGKSGQDAYYEPEEALELGVIDEIIKDKK